MVTRAWCGLRRTAWMVGHQPGVRFTLVFRIIAIVVLVFAIVWLLGFGGVIG